MTTTPFQAARRLVEEYNVNISEPHGGFNPVAAANGLLELPVNVAKGGGLLHVYDDASGVYRPGMDLLRKILVDFLGETWRPTRADAVVRYLDDSAPCLWERPPSDQVNVRNGILCLATGELMSHAPTWLSPIQIGAVWNPDAGCPRISRFVEDVVPSDTVKLVYEIAGLLCVPDMTFQTAVLLLGAGNNGKSTLIGLLGAVVGAENVAHVGLHELGSNRFAAAELYGKLANLCPDIPNRKPASVATFKAITGGDPIPAERKYGQPFTFEPFSRFVFSANSVPDSPDTSPAYLRRWQVIPFPNRFQGDKADRNLLDKLTTPEELSGFLSLAVEAYRGLQERGHFSTAESTDQAKLAFEEDVAHVLTFLGEKTLVDARADVDRARLADAYRDWCKSEAHHAPLTRQKFFEEVRQHVPGITQKTVRGRTTWVGLGLTQGESQGDGKGDENGFRFHPGNPIAT